MRPTTPSPSTALLPPDRPAPTRETGEIARTDKADRTFRPGGEVRLLCSAAAAAERIEQIHRVREALGDASRSEGRYEVPPSLRPAFEAAVDSLMPSGASHAVWHRRPVQPRDQPGAAWLGSLLGRRQRSVICRDMPQGGIQMMLKRLRNRLVDALDVMSPRRPPEFDREACLERPLDPGLQQLAAWWGPRLSEDAAGLFRRSDVRRTGASCAEQAAAQIHDFDPRLCEDLVHRLITEGDSDGAWDLLCAVRAEDDRNLPTMNSYLTLIRQFGMERRGLRSEQVFDRMKALFPREMSTPALAQQPYDDIIWACVQCCDFARLRRHAQAMRQCGCRWDAGTLAVTITAQLAGRDVAEATRLLGEAREAGVPVNQSHLMPLISERAANAEYGQACRIIQDSVDRNEGAFAPGLGWTGQLLDARPETLFGTGAGTSDVRRGLILSLIELHNRRGVLGDRLDMIVARRNELGRDMTLEDLPHWNGWTAFNHEFLDSHTMRIRLTRSRGKRALNAP